MNAPVYVRQAFRSCTASLSSRTIARSSRDALPLRGSRLARQYSDDKTTEERSQADAAKEGEIIEITPEAELLEKLKAKDAESMDLKVSTRPRTRLHLLIYFLRVAYSTCKQISSTCNAMPPAKKSSNVILPSPVSLGTSLRP